MNRLSAAVTALVVIDAQPGFYKNRPDVDHAAFGSFLQHTAWLVGVATALCIPIVVTNERPERNGDTAPEIAAALPPGTAAFVKATFDLCSDENIRAAVDDTARSTVVLVGMETDVCVAQSALGLIDHGKRVAAVVDATFSPGVAHEHGLDRMRGAGVTLVSTKGLFYEWVPSLAELADFKRSNPALARPDGIQL